MGEYADARGRDSVGQLLGLAPAPLAMWQSFGIFVFDNGAYGAQHYESLASLLRAIPPRLHAIRAIIVPEATGIAPGAAFIASGPIVYLPYVAMDVYTSPLEFPEYRGVGRSSRRSPRRNCSRDQAVQFWKRPGFARRDIVLAARSTWEALPAELSNGAAGGTRTIRTNCCPRWRTFTRSIRERCFR